MLENLHTILEDKCRLTMDRPVILGLSGGPDSLCLLDCLRRLGFPLIVAHLDHGLRPESGEEALAVEAMCAI